MTRNVITDPFALVGATLEGQYRVERIVGEGGFGVVYRGRHLALDQPVAIKALKGLDAEDPRINELVLQKFREEARLLYTLSQSSLHIVRSTDFGAVTTPSGAWAPFMILEWLDGVSLSDDLDARRERGMRGRSLDEAFAILEPAAEGLGIAHQRHVAHRDIKPGNLFLLRDKSGPTVKVLDFGIAKIMKEGEQAGTKGTFASFTWLYAAPEQLDPRVGQTGLATDVYAFTLLLTELLTDRTPVEGRDVVAILKAATDPTRRPTPRSRGANVPDDVEAVCRRALAVDPKQRYATVTELWSALASARASRAFVVTRAHAAAPMSMVSPSLVGSGAVPPAPGSAPLVTPGPAQGPFHTPPARPSHTAMVPSVDGRGPSSPRHLPIPTPAQPMAPPSVVAPFAPIGPTGPIGPPPHAPPPHAPPLHAPPPHATASPLSPRANPPMAPPVPYGPPPGPPPPRFGPPPPPVLYGPPPQPPGPMPQHAFFRRPPGSDNGVVVAVIVIVVVLAFFSTCAGVIRAC